MAGAMTGSRRRAALLGMVLGMTGAGAAWAQQEEFGAKSTITYSLGTNAGTNLDLDPGMSDSSVQLNGMLGYDYDKRTRQTQLSFSAAIRPQTDDNGDEGLYPSAGLSLVHEAPRTKLTFRASYSRTRVSDQSIGYDDTGSIVTYDSTGQRGVARVSLGLEGGIDMPLGYGLSMSRSEIDYYGAIADDDYTANSTDSISGHIRADVSAMTQLRLNLAHSYYSSESLAQTRRTTDRATLGLTQRIDSLTTISGSLGRQRVETERTSSTTTKNGTVFGLDLRRDDPLGSYSLGFDRSVTENGTRDSVVVGRERESRLSNLSGTLGASQGDSGGTDWIGSLSYSFSLPRDELSASLSRAVRTDDDGDDVVVTRLSGGIVHSLSDLNAIDFDVTASTLDYSDRDRLRLDTSLAYQHRLTQQVNLSAGVRFRLSQDSNKADAESQSLFLTLTRRFERLH